MDRYTTYDIDIMLLRETYIDKMTVM